MKKKHQTFLHFLEKCVKNDPHHKTLITIILSTITALRLKSKSFKNVLNINGELNRKI